MIWRFSLSSLSRCHSVGYADDGVGPRQDAPNFLDASWTPRSSSTASDRGRVILRYLDSCQVMDTTPSSALVKKAVRRTGHG